MSEGEANSRAEQISTRKEATLNEISIWGYFICTIKKFLKLMIEGRARRKEFWGFALFYFLFLLVAGLADYLLFGEGEDTFFLDVYDMFFAIPLFSVAFRRMHDVGKPAGFIFIPLYGLYLSVQDSDKGTNKYGPSPKEA